MKNLFINIANAFGALIVLVLQMWYEIILILLTYVVYIYQGPQIAGVYILLLSLIVPISYRLNRLAFRQKKIMDHLFASSQLIKEATSSRRKKRSIFNGDKINRRKVGRK